MNPLEKPFILMEKAIYTLIHNQLLKLIKPTFNLNNVTNIDLELVKKLKSEYGIGGLIVDIDDTLRSNSPNIPQCNQQWLEYMKQEFKIAIVSNGHSDVIQNTLKEMQIDYYSLCKKPGRKYFLQAADKMGLNPENVLVIGNEAIMDVWGGNRSRNVYCRCK